MNHQQKEGIVEMKITDRVKGIEGIEDAFWDGRQNRLVVYYKDSALLDTVKIKVAGAIAEVGLQRAVDKVTLISMC